MDSHFKLKPMEYHTITCLFSKLQSKKLGKGNNGQKQSGET